MAVRRCGRRRDACGRDPMPCAEHMANDLTLTLLLSSFAWWCGVCPAGLSGERGPPCFSAECFRRMHPGVVVVYVMRCGSFSVLWRRCTVSPDAGIVPGIRIPPRLLPPLLLSPGEKGRGYFFRRPFLESTPPYKRSSLLQLPLRKEKYKKKPTRGRIVSAVPTNQKDTAPCRVSLEKEVSK